MKHLVSFTHYEDALQYRCSESVPPLDPQDWYTSQPDAHWAVVDGQVILARCSLWWSRTPPYHSQRVGFLGHYAANDSDAAGKLIGHCCKQLAQQGCSRALAPVDGSTWRNYRFITEYGDWPPFFFEPNHPSDWPDHFLSQGFVAEAKYFSSLNTNLEYEDPALGRVAERLAARGVSVRPLNAQQFEDDLRAILRVARLAFSQHLLYDDIEEAEFLDHYRKLREVTGVELTLIAEHEGQPVGFAFAVPDLLQHRRGQRIETMVVKTLGTVPRRDLAGLGQLLLTSVHRQGLRLGFRRAVYALVFDSPPLRRLSGRYARRVREYTLFGKPLQP